MTAVAERRPDDVPLRPADRSGAPRTSGLSRPADIALTLAAVGGLLCLLMAGAGVVFGLTTLIVRTDSMTPTAPAGSIALAQKVSGPQLQVGDIVSVRSPYGPRVMHRVVAVTARSQVAATVVLKGDANAAPDPAPYVVGTGDRVSLVIPGAGYVLSWVSSPAGRVLGALVAIALLAWAFGRTRAPEEERGGPRPVGRHRATPAATSTAVAVTVLVAVTAMTVQAAPARAALTVTATTRSTHASNGFAAFMPAGLRCSTTSVLTLSDAVLSWTGVGPGYAYLLTFYTGPGATGPVKTNQLLPAAAAGATVSYTPTAADVTRLVGTGEQYVWLRTVRLSDGMLSGRVLFTGMWVVPLTGRRICTITGNVATTAAPPQSYTVTSSAAALRLAQAAPTVESTGSPGTSTGSPGTSTGSPGTSTGSPGPSTETTTPTSTTGSTPTTTPSDAVTSTTSSSTTPPSSSTPPPGDSTTSIPGSTSGDAPASASPPDTDPISGGSPSPVSTVVSGSGRFIAELAQTGLSGTLVIRSALQPTALFTRAVPADAAIAWAGDRLFITDSRGVEVLEQSSSGWTVVAASGSDAPAPTGPSTTAGEPASTPVQVAPAAAATSSDPPGSG
ncbi:signal peptidase I [Williamsia sp. CHRR-6]|uniref:signal peptidase I n=1 Tax=Williamsia sp. CHRR-6 TaxID=2835871 RepID=UPI001BD9DDEA|nr:signal peptidase I [Williamsia sp. CHRR-6]MBT0568288.1 signal peptidase I [Williamsia sp. CHRR-6]